MSHIEIQGGRPLRGTVRPPGDKSISHRSLIFNALADGSAKVDGLLDSEDVHHTAECLRQLGVSIEGGQIRGVGGTLRCPEGPLFCGNSGTTFRLLLGALSGQSFGAVLSGDASLQSRPMARVVEPLEAMGAAFVGDAQHPPISIRGGRLKNTHITSTVSSAQVKTAVMLAALQGEGELVFREPTLSRDHTERMFRAMGIAFEDQLEGDGRHVIRLVGPQTLRAVDFVVPGDISSAAFFAVAAAITPGSEVLIENVGVNPSRAGVLDVLDAMGARVTAVGQRLVGGEPVADLEVQYSHLQGVEISGAMVPRLIDEIPVLAVAMAHAAGTSRVTDAHELRVKESDRIVSTLSILGALGLDPVEFTDGFSLTGQGGRNLSPIHIDAKLDHRIAMAGLVAGAALSCKSRIEGTDSIATSFPDFFTQLERLRG